MAVSYYDTLQKPSKASDELAVCLLDALQSVGVHHHLNADLLAEERRNYRRQEGCSCGFWILHYIEEEIRCFGGEGKFSFHPDLRQRLDLMNGFADRLR